MTSGGQKSKRTRVCDPLGENELFGKRREEESRNKQIPLFFVVGLRELWGAAWQIDQLETFAE